MRSPRVKLMLALLVLLGTAAFSGLSVLSAPAAHAAACSSQGATRWRQISCCGPLNSKSYKMLEWCNGGVWTDTGTRDCRASCAI